VRKTIAVALREVELIMTGIGQSLATKIPQYQVTGLAKVLQSIDNVIGDEEF